jgi:secondary thiamine-phosphate synthase enzyme
MKVFQKELTLPSFRRGFHLITPLITRDFTGMHQIQSGLLQVFIRHTSASLSLNENADPTVREDFEAFFNRLVPENSPYFEHNDEGPDDMPAHLKASLLGSSVLVPISGGRLNLGTWQGIYLCEHRNHGGPRHLVLTAFGV